jgi:hypothetical protein
LACSAAAFAAPASADVNASAFSAEEIQDATDRMVAVGIDDTTRQALLQKLERGELLDSTTDAAPVRSFDGMVNGQDAKIKEYADGSRRWETVQVPGVASDVGSGDPQARAGISDCTESAGVGSWWYTGCRVSTEDVVSSSGFVVDYKTTNIAGDVAQVRDPRGSFCHLAGGSCTVSAAVIDHEFQEGTSPARASMSFTGTIKDDATSLAGSVWIDVFNLDATASNTPVTG